MEKAINKEKNPGLFKKFIFWLFIPLLFVLFFALLIATILGVNVFEKAKALGEKTPVIQHLFTEKEQVNLVEFEEKITGLEVELQDRNVQLDLLGTDLDKKDAENKRLLLEQERLENTIEELRQIQNDHKRSFKDIVSTYEMMAPKNAAPIIMEMEEKEAIKILSNLNKESLAKIMEKMPPDKAANYFAMLTATIE